uniref:Alternative protein SCLY n=1 Tax=Homo sapiens TaxID=9606 RepID=L8E8S1_HUMAN|nr:alternative protein SCLY [Homo sapiens]
MPPLHFVLECQRVCTPSFLPWTPAELTGPRTPTPHRTAHMGPPT